MLWTTIILSSLIGLLVIEKLAIERSVRKLDLRIHVNGTRGKSSVTEYIAAGLSRPEFDVIAKITGIIPTIILNGVKSTINRNGIARVQEQVGFIRFAARKRVKSVVMECMSISPDLQLLESRLFKPHIYVITNIRDDHREEMGSDIEDQADSICNAIPRNCTVITNEERFLNKIMDAAVRNNCTVINPQNYGPKFLEDLPDGVFSENIALALSVCSLAGVDSKMAEKSILNYISENKTYVIPVCSGNRTIRFLNAFAVNDVDSTNSFIDRWKITTDHAGKFSIIFNTRSDRPVRTDLFAGWIGTNSSSIDKIVITGNHSARAKYSIIKSGVDKSKIFVWTNKQISRTKESFLSTFNDGAMVIGIGNIAGDGLNIINKLI